ncbi:MAG: hypothetical protein JEY99_03075 [Spirochaetales bacterium]|nr:hypothetical protein [Spirochaetales bacterium]
MTKMTDYDDNLFIITERTKLLERSAILDIDPDLFSGQFKHDLTFIKDALSQIRGQLENSAHTLKKPENLRNLMIANIRAEKLSIQLENQGYIPRDDDNNFATFFKEEADILEEILLAESENSGDTEQVSMEEFEFLLKESPDNED